MASQLECKLRIDKLFKRKRFRQKDIDIVFFLKRLKQAWNRSRIYAVGEGGVGKTSLCNGLIGKPFSESEKSTRGVDSFSCSILDAGVMSDEEGNWGGVAGDGEEYAEFFRAFARTLKKDKEMANTDGNDDIVNTDSSISTDNDSSISAKFTKFVETAKLKQSGVPIRQQFIEEDLSAGNERVAGNTNNSKP